jgi:GAF domain-containing protein
VVHASVPLRSGNQALGILNVAAPDWQAFSEEALVLLANVGSQMGAALERARLFELIKEQHIHQQSVLLQLSQQLLGHRDLDEVMAYVVEEVTRLLAVDSCAILLVDPADEKFLVFSAAFGWYSNPVATGRKVPASEQSGAGWVMINQEPLVVEDLKSDDPTPWSAPWLQPENFRGQASVPLVVEEHSIGTLVVHNRSPRILDEDELDLLQLMANQAAMAIENARLQREEIERQRMGR